MLLRSARQACLSHAPRLQLLRCSLSSGLGKGFDISSMPVLSDSEHPRSLVRGYGSTFFEINDTILNSSAIVLPYSFYAWKARTPEDVTLNSLRFLATVSPTIEILVIGYGSSLSKPPDPKIIEYFKERGIVVEAMDTLNATSTFNFLAGDGRYVAAALLTLEPATEDANSIARSYVSDTDKQDTYGA